MQPTSGAMYNILPLSPIKHNTSKTKLGYMNLFHTHQPIFSKQTPKHKDRIMIMNIDRRFERFQPTINSMCRKGIVYNALFLKQSQYFIKLDYHQERDKTHPAILTHE
jgi:hypothetical protein